MMTSVKGVAEGKATPELALRLFRWVRQRLVGKGLTVTGEGTGEEETASRNPMVG
jgi:hypothetical protein